MHFLPSLFHEACPIGGGVARVVLDVVVDWGGGRRGGSGGGHSNNLSPGFGHLSSVGIKGVILILLPETLICWVWDNGSGEWKGRLGSLPYHFLGTWARWRDPKQDQLTRTLSILLDQQPAAQLVITL